MVEVDDGAALSGTPDGFERLWTPHRMVYIKGENKPPAPSPAACPFCAAPAGEDRTGLIVHRGELAYVVLNLYPVFARPPAGLPLPARCRLHGADRS